MGKTLPWLLLWCCGDALAETPLLLPPTEPASNWEVAARMAGFSLVTTPVPGVVRVVIDGDSWEIRTRDPNGVERKVRVDAPTTPGEREDLLWVAASLASPMDSATLRPPLIVPPGEKTPPEKTPPNKTPSTTSGGKPPAIPAKRPELQAPPWQPDTSPWTVPPDRLPPPASATRADLVAAEPLPRTAPPPPPATPLPPPVSPAPRISPSLAVGGGVVSTASLLTNANAPQLSVRGSAELGFRVLDRLSVGLVGAAQTASPVPLLDQTASLTRRELALSVGWAADAAWRPGVSMHLGGARLGLREGVSGGDVQHILVPMAGMRLTLAREIGSGVGIIFSGGLDGDLYRVWVEQSLAEDSTLVPTTRGIFQASITWSP